MKKQRARLPEIYIIEEEPKIEDKKPQATRGSGRQKFLIRAGILLPLVLLVQTLAHSAGEVRLLPAFLQGTWETSDSRYIDCSMEITPGTVSFDNGEKGYLLYFISSVEEIHNGGRGEYLVHYTDLDGVKYQMSLVYSPRPRESVHFSHQAGVIWTRRAPE